METRYVREYFIPFRMMPDRMAQVREQLPGRSGDAGESRFCAHRVLLQRRAMERAVPSRLRSLVPGRGARAVLAVSLYGAVLLLLLVAVLLAVRPVHEKRARTAAAFCMAATGFTLMALQIFLLLLFQSVYGYVYHQLAVLIAMFMAGIALGSWLGIRHVVPAVTAG